MKRTLLLIALVLCCATAIFAQNNKISYQAVVRDAQNRLVDNQPVTVTVSIFNGSATTAAYSETQEVTTNVNGLISLLVGGGTVTGGNWESIDWKTARIETAVALNGATLGMLEIPFTAVPYAMYAEYADSATLADHAMNAHYSDSVNLNVIAHYLSSHNIPDGAGVNAQSDWNQTDILADDYIKNKPTNVSAFANDANYATQTEVTNNVDSVKGNIRNEISTLETTMNSADAALAARIVADSNRLGLDSAYLKGLIDANATNISNLTNTMNSADAALAARIVADSNRLGLDSAYLKGLIDANSTNINNLTNTMNSADAALAARIVADSNRLGLDSAYLKGLIDDNANNINNLTNTMNAADAALSNRITADSNRLVNFKSKVHDDSLALAGQITTLSNSVDNKTGALSNRISADSNRLVNFKSKVHDDSLALAGQITTLSNSVDNKTGALSNRIVADSNRLVALKNRVNTFNTHLCDSVDTCVKNIVRDTATALRGLIKNTDDKFANYYTKTEVAANVDSVKTNLRKEIKAKADTGSVYTRDQINTKLADTAKYATKVKVKQDSTYLKGLIDANASAIPTTVAQLTDANNYVTTNYLNEQHYVSNASCNTVDICTLAAQMAKMQETIDSLKGVIAAVSPKLTISVGETTLPLSRTCNASLHNADIGNYTLKWTVDGTDSTTTNNPLTVNFTTEGTHKVICTATRDGYATLKDSVNITVAKGTPTVTAPTAVAASLTYSGSAQTLFNAGLTTGGTMKYMVTNENTQPANMSDFTENIEQGTDAGTYYLWYYVDGGLQYNSTSVNSTAISKAIAKANASVTTAPTNKAPTYSGSAQAYANAGTASGGTMMYCSTEDGTYLTDLPTATNVGNYTLWYYVEGDDNHNSTSKVSVSCSIAKATPNVTAPTAKSETFTYNGNAQTLFNTGSTNAGTMKYKVTTTNSEPSSTSDFKTTIDQGTNAGTYYLWYYVEGNDNYNSTAVNNTAVTKAIGQATNTLTCETDPISFAQSEATNSTKTRSASVTNGTISVSSSDASKVTASYSNGTITLTRKTDEAFSGVTITVSVTPDGNHTAPDNVTFSVSAVAYDPGVALASSSAGYIVSSNGKAYPVSYANSWNSSWGTKAGVVVYKSGSSGFVVSLYNCGGSASSDGTTYTWANRTGGLSSVTSVSGRTWIVGSEDQYTTALTSQWSTAMGYITSAGGRTLVSLEYWSCTEDGSNFGRCFYNGGWFSGSKKSFKYYVRPCFAF